MRFFIYGIVGLIVLVLIFVVVVVILIFTGGRDLDAECGDRLIDTSPFSSTQFDDEWDDFDDAIGAGQSRFLIFVEGAVMQRADAWLLEENIDELREVTICLFSDDIGEAKGKIKVPVLPDISAKIRGTMDLSGNFPVLTIDDIDIGNAGFIIDIFGLESEIKDAINEALDNLDLQNAPYQLAIGAGSATISGG